MLISSINTVKEKNQKWGVCMKYGVKVIYTYSVGEDCRKTHTAKSSYDV